MTDETRRLLDKLDRNLNDILFDLVEENETLEGQVDELREQVARLREKQNHKTVDVKLGGELIYRQAVLDAIEDDTRLGMYSRFASNNDAQLFKQVVNEIPPAENKGEWIPIKTRPLTEEEKEYYEENGAFYFDFIFDCCLPEDGQEILITTKYETVDKTTFYNEGDDGSYFEDYEDEGEVLAWRPLPEPYKAEKGGEE